MESSKIKKAALKRLLKVDIIITSSRISENAD